MCTLASRKEERTPLIGRDEATADHWMQTVIGYVKSNKYAVLDKSDTIIIAKVLYICKEPNITEMQIYTFKQEFHILGEFIQ